MTDADKRMDTIAKLMQSLGDPLPVGAELRQQILRLGTEKQFRDAVRCCRELYQLGLTASNAYVQGVAYHYLGSVFFGLGERDNDWNKAIEYYKQSVQLFRTCLGNQREHNEGVAQFSIGIVYEAQAVELGKDKWKEGIEAYEAAQKLFDQKSDLLTEEATSAARRLTQNWADWMTKRKKAEEKSTSTPFASETVPRTEKSAPSRAASSEPSVEVVVAPVGILSGIKSLYVLLVQVSLLALQIIVGALAVFGTTALWMIPSFYRDVVLYAVSFFLISLCATCIVLTVSGQVIYRLAPHCAAVAQYHNRNTKRIWTIEEPGVHWVDPFHEHISAFILMAPAPVDCFQRNTIAPNAPMLNVRVVATVRVDDPQRTWDAIGSSLPTKRYLGIPRPARLDETTKRIQDEARRLVRAVIAESTCDEAHREFFSNDQKRDEHFASLLATKSIPLGLRFENVQVEVFSSN